MKDKNTDSKQISSKQTSSKQTLSRQTSSEQGFGKGQILGSSKYKNRSDALSVILKDNKEYSLDEVDSMLEKFMKGKVN
jgi:hypothetical protein